MKLNDARTGIEILDRDACLDLLAVHDVGRLGVVDHGSPRIFPVNYVLDGDAVVFRTAPGTKLDAGTRAPACFEVDELDPATRSGWSVLAVGFLEEVTSLHGDRWTRVQALPLDPWSTHEKSHFVRLVPQHIDGRRLPLTDS